MGSRLAWQPSLRHAQRTVDLLIEPVESGSGELLVWGSVGEGVGYGDGSEEFVNGALHSQLVEICVKEGNDAFREGRAAVEVHDGRLFGLTNSKTRR